MLFWSGNNDSVKLRRVIEHVYKKKGSQIDEEKCKFYMLHVAYMHSNLRSENTCTPGGEEITSSATVSSILDFEDHTAALKHRICNECKCVSLTLPMKRNRDNLCSPCGDKGAKRKEMDYLPVWYDRSNTVRFDVPDELECLTDGEKLLIQRASPFVPLHHIKNGILGMRGHCCCFPQAVEEVCNVLPRQPSSAKFINYVQTYKQEIGGNFSTKQFRINRKRVLEALRWLKEFNKVYSDITIDESNLNWMGEHEERNLPATISTETSIQKDTIEEEMALRETVCNKQNAIDLETNIEEVACYGVLGECDNFELSEEDCEISKELSSCTKKTKNCHVQDWPRISDRAISEHDPSMKIFCMIFPWLFPGGVGDISCTNDGSMSKETWAKRMMMYEDGRFAKDKAFCFYALNYLMRRRNQSQGGFYVNHFNKGGPTSLSALKEKLETGNSKFVEKVSYFSKQICGSNAFWRLQREKVYSWINQMVEWGNGGPNMFITLSCAEYHWPDIVRLLEERLSIAAGKPISFEGKKNLIVKHSNELTIVVQEYFQQRVKIWLKYIGEPLFGIKKYWLRYEFAPGRGQIHCHMLAISNWTIFQEIYEAKLSKEDRAKHLGRFLQQKIGMTACLKEEKTNDQTPHPSDISFRDVSDHMKDTTSLKQTLMTHICNEYCLRTQKGNSKKRVCRVGFGEEANSRKGDTPGIKIQNGHTIENRDSRNHQKLYMTRDNTRLTQCSELLLRSWRANCDIQILLYDSDPKHPDAAEISEVTDYVVGYCCKGNLTHQDEKNQMRALIKR